MAENYRLGIHKSWCACYIRPGKYDPDEGDDNDNAWDSDFKVGQLRRARRALFGKGTTYMTHDHAALGQLEAQKNPAFAPQT